MSANAVVLEAPVAEKESAVPIIVKDGTVRRRLKLAAAAMAIFGLALMYVAYSAGQTGTGSLLLSITGVTVVLLSILFYALSPSKFLRNDVCDAMCLTGAEYMYRAIVPLAAGGQWIYVPPALSGEKQTMLGAREAGDGATPGPASAGPISADRKGKDALVIPPGHGLMEHAKRLGATFTAEGLEDEIRDVLVNGFELAGSVAVDRGRDRVSIEMRNIANSAMCGMLRKKDAAICTGAGCPLCSFAACMVAEGTGRRAAIEQASARGKNVTLTLGLV